MKFSLILIFICCNSTISFSQNDDDYVTKKRFAYIEKNGKYYITENEKIVSNKGYEFIRTPKNYLCCYYKKRYTIFSQDSGKLIIDSVSAIQQVNYGHKYFQLLKNNKLLWLTPNSTIINESPHEQVMRWLCGTVNAYSCFTGILNDSSYFFMRQRGLGSESDSLIKKINITPFVGIHPLLFLNNLNTLEYTDNSEFDEQLNQYTFFEKKEEGLFDIIQLNINEEVVTKTVLAKSINEYYGMDKVNDYLTFNSFIFKQGTLYGYFPMMRTAKYTFLNPFDYFFARFELPNGKKGWLARNGKEYFDE